MLRAIFPPRVATQCETCRFWQPDDEQDEVVLGECRIQAPEFNPVPADRPTRTR